VAAPAAAGRGGVFSLALAATGVVYGDIGTSPLYAIRESLRPEHGITPTPAAVLGVLSLIFWSLLLVISGKYLGLILRADNRGEGGVLALAALITPRGNARGHRRTLILIGLFATALLYGDGMITPAISVLSAVEGLNLATPALEPYVLPITIGILVALFAFQRRGTSGVGKVFGPVMVVWFVVLAGLGVWHVARYPAVLQAVLPYYAIRFFADNGFTGFVVLGAVFLVVTGGEALYADLGHFGRRPIRVAWFVLVLPALLLNYFGQGAIIMADPGAAESPFYQMVSGPALYPLIALATVATVIASQALISGAYSLTMQAVQLGYLPRLTIQHTSAAHIGQIYVPVVNWLLMLACIGLVLGFRSSGNLAAAYGVAVTATMAVTTLLFLVYARERQGWPLAGVLALGAALLAIDLAFLGANLLKIPDGGWFPLLVGALLFTLLTTWQAGRRAVSEKLSARGIPPRLFLDDVLGDSPVRVAGTAVYMSSIPDSTPPALLHNLKHNRVLHEHVVFLSVVTERVPYVPVAVRSVTERLGPGVHQVLLRFGFLDKKDVPAALRTLSLPDVKFAPLATTYFLGRESIVAGSREPPMSRWRLALFRVLSRNAQDAALFFCLPPNRVVELGTQIEL
jgi:KUP system potassium uptake protein